MGTCIMRLKRFMSLPVVTLILFPRRLKTAYSVSVSGSVKFILRRFIDNMPFGGGVRVGKKITDNHNTKERPKRPDLQAVLDRSLPLTDQKLKNQSVKECDPV